MNKATFNTKIVLLILVSFFIAFMLLAIPLPHWISWLRVPWVTLVLIYWALAMPKNIGVGTAWIIGLLLDGLYNVPLGENALALVIVIYFALKFSEKIKYFILWQEMLAICGLLLIYYIVPFLLQSVTKQNIDLLICVTQAVTGALIWPVIALLLFYFQRRCDIEDKY